MRAENLQLDEKMTTLRDSFSSTELVIHFSLHVTNSVRISHPNKSFCFLSNSDVKQRNNIALFTWHKKLIYKMNGASSAIVAVIVFATILRSSYAPSYNDFTTDQEEILKRLKQEDEKYKNDAASSTRKSQFCTQSTNILSR